MVPDFLSDFRNWGQYTEIDELLHVRPGGFRAYLDQDLTILVFFYAAIAEIATIAMLGPGRVLEAAESIFKSLVTGNERLWRAPAPQTLDVRLRVYEHKGLLPKGAWQAPIPPPLASPPQLI